MKKAYGDQLIIDICHIVYIKPIDDLDFGPICLEVELES